MVGDVEEDSFVRFPDLGLLKCVPLLLSLGQVGYGVVDAFLEEGYQLICSVSTL